MISYDLSISGNMGSNLATIQHRCEFVALFQPGIADLPLSSIASVHRSADTGSHFLLLLLIFDF
jgi:hypothetical protein